MNVNVKKDKNNFINIILNKVSLAQHFHQRVALTITKRRILNHIMLRFYLRRRFKTLYLYTRLDDKFGSKTERHNFYKDIRSLIPSIKVEGTQGNYTGFILELCNETNNDLILFLKLISLLSKPQDFYVKKSKVFQSYLNYTDSSKIPIHLRFTVKQLEQLTCGDLKILFNSITEVKRNDKEKYINNINFDDSTSL